MSLMLTTCLVCKLYSNTTSYSDIIEFMREALAIIDSHKTDPDRVRLTDGPQNFTNCWMFPSSTNLVYNQGLRLPLNSPKRLWGFNEITSFAFQDDVFKINAAIHDWVTIL